LFFGFDYQPFRIKKEEAKILRTVDFPCVSPIIKICKNFAPMKKGFMMV